jgi:hypothetical protein
MYFAVAMMELGKLIIAYIYIIKDRGANKGIWQQCKEVWTLSPLSYVFKFCIPAVFYALSNNLMYILLELEAPAEYVLLWNFKVVATTFLLSYWLKRKYTQRQYIAVFSLTFGIVLTQISHFKHESGDASKSSSNSTSTTPTISASETKYGIERFVGVMLGPTLTIMGATLTAFTNVYCEYIYKQTKPPVYDETKNFNDTFWMKNVRLYTFGVVVNLISFFIYELKQNKAEYVFHGFNFWVLITIILGATSGLLVGIVMNVVDNIAIIHADGMGTILTTVLSVIYFHFVLDVFFVAGGLIIISSIYLFHADKFKISCLNTKAAAYKSISTNSDNTSINSISNGGMAVSEFEDTKHGIEGNVEDEEDDSTEETPLIL